MAVAKKAAPAKKPAAKAAAPAKAAATAKATVKAAPQATVTLKHIGAALAEEHDLPKKQADQLVSDVFSRIAEHLLKGDRIRIGGFGILQVRARPARTGRNPATNAVIQIAASKKVAFRPAKELKESV